MQGRLIKTALLLLAIITTSTSKAEEYPADLVYDTGSEITTNFRHFTQVMGGDDIKFTLLKYECFRKTNPQIPVGLVQFDTPLLHKSKSEKAEYPRPRFPYSIVVASYATAEEAHQALATARDKIKLNALFECLKFEKSDENKKAFKEQFYTYEIRTKINKWPKLLKRSPMPNFDGISIIKKNYQESKVKGEPVAAVAAVVKRVIYTDRKQVQAELAAIQSLYPELHFAALQQGKYYYISPAANTKDTVLKEAILQMRRRGLYEYTYTAKLSAKYEELTKQKEPPIEGLPGQKTTFDYVPEIYTQTINKEISILEMEDLVAPIQERVATCIKTIKIPDPPRNTDGKSDQSVKIEPGIPLDIFSACSGVILDRIGMTRCLLNSECSGIRVPINWDKNSVDIIKSCVLDPKSTCAGTTIDPAYAEALRIGHIELCFDNPNSSECNEKIEKFSKICETEENKKLCESNKNLASSIAIRTAELQRCIMTGLCQRIIPRPPGIEETIKNELELAKKGYEEKLYPVKEGLAFLSTKPKELVDKIKSCQGSTKTDKAASAKCFASLALSPEEQKSFECFNNKEEGLDKVNCFIQDPKVQKIVKDANCLKEADGDPVAMAKCAGLEEISQIEDKYRCALKESSALNAIGKCSDVIPSYVTEALTCISDSNNSRAKLAACIPGQSKESKAVTCLATAQSDGERMNCVTTAIPLDPKAKKAMECIANSNGDSQAAARCAMGDLLPGDLGKAVACGSTSTGAVDFALCVAGPQMNAELRMAAQCAASTGGEPMSFATCTAGSLTVAELSKCMSGEIGREGGCFGPNNTIVKALTNAINDMIFGLGDSNELVKTYKEIEKNVQNINDAFVDLGQKLGDALEDNLVRPFRCAFFGC